jgi:hypothetical protein
MLQLNAANEDEQVSLSLYGYFRHYRFQLQEFLMRGVEEFDSTRIVMPEKTKIKIQEEINRIDLILNAYANYRKNMIQYGTE